MSGGVKAALDAAVDQAQDEPEAVAGDLFADLGVEDTGALDAPSPLTDAFTPRKRRGRPQGSKNRRTEAVAAWLLSQGRHPLLVMMEAYAMSPAELAARLGMKAVDDDQLLEIYKLQLRMAEAVAPYVAQRLPQAVQVAAAGHLSIAFEGVSLPARGGPAGNPEPIEGELALRLPVRSDGDGRTDG